MSNKLQELFTDTEEIFTGTIRFSNRNAVSSFNDILEKVYQDGLTYTVDNVDTVEMNCVDGDNVYQWLPSEKPEKLIVGPSVNSIKLPVYVDGNKREFELYSIKLKDGVKAYTKKDAIVDFDIFFCIDQTKNRLTFKAHPIDASNLCDIVESYELAYGLLDVLLVNHSEEYKESQAFFKQNILFFKRLISVQNALKTSFSVEEVVNGKDYSLIVNKLYYLLCDRKVIRTEPSFRDKCNASIGFQNDEDFPEDINIGSTLFAYYLSDQEVDLYGRTIKLFTVNWLFNAVVREIEKNDDGILHLHLKDNDSNPMYLSYSGFLTEEDALNEIEIMMDRKKEYMNALTFSELLEEDLEITRQEMEL